MEVLYQAQDLVHLFDGEGLGLQFLVFFHEGQEVGLLIGLEDFLHGVDAQGLHLGALLFRHPGSVRGEFRQHLVPLFLGDAGLFGGKHQGCHFLHGGLPGGVDSLLEGEFTLR